jgi:hypothetical protein
MLNVDLGRGQGVAGKKMLKLMVVGMLVAICAGCAGVPSDSAGGSSINMYGVIDQGVSYRK